MTNLIFGNNEFLILNNELPNKLNFLGFIPSDKSKKISKIIPININNNSFLISFSNLMISNDYDAIFYFDKDYLLRSSIINENKIILFFCILDQPAISNEKQFQIKYPEFDFNI